MLVPTKMTQLLKTQAGQLAYTEEKNSTKQNQSWGGNNILSEQPVMMFAPKDGFSKQN